MAKTSKIFLQKEVASSSRPAGEKPVVEPRPEELIPGMCGIDSDFKVKKPSSVPGRCEPISRYMCSIPKSFLDQAKEDCNWGDKEVVIPTPEEAITTYVERYLSVYTYPFTLSPLDPVIVDFCKKYQVTLGQIHPSFWRVVILLHFIVSKIDGLPFTLDHLIRLYSHRLYRGGLIKLQHRATKSLISSIDEDKDRDWMGQFVRVKTTDLIPTESMPFS